MRKIFVVAVRVSMFREEIIIKRDCEALLIPSAVSITLLKGSRVVMAQALGDSFTVETEGNLVRVLGNDADALGLTPQKRVVDWARAEVLTEDLIWEVLKTCYDPEIPVNIVELGLVYACQIIPLEKGFHRIQIKMTLTAPGCGMGPVLAAEVEQKLKELPDVTEVAVELVFDPPWDRDKMSKAAQLQLGML